MTTISTQAVDSDSGARPFATVNPYTGETVREFPFLDSGQIPDVVGRAATAFQSWRERPVAEPVSYQCAHRHRVIERECRAREFTALRKHQARD